MRWPTRHPAWPKARAGLIALAIGVSLLQGCPYPRVDRAALAHPLAREQTEWWSARLATVGVDRSAAELAAAIVALSEGVGALQRRLIAPFAPWFELTGTSQYWKLFPTANPDPLRMRVEARTPGGAWELLYRPLDPEHRYERARLEYRRLRAAWNPGTRGPRRPYRRFVDWLTRRLAGAPEGWVTVRVGMERLHVPLPGEPTVPPRGPRYVVSRPVEAPR